MNPRVEYEMSEQDFNDILDACKPTPVLFVSGGVPIGGSPQENANAAWSELGRRMGFDYMSVRPVVGKNARFFTAIPSETQGQREARLKREADAKLEAKIAEHRAAIKAHTEALAKLEAKP